MSALVSKVPPTETKTATVPFNTTLLSLYYLHKAVTMKGTLCKQPQFLDVWVKAGVFIS